MANPFDFLNAINQTKKDILEDEKDYPAWMVNKGLSYFDDTILYANMMNLHHHLDPKPQFDFYIHSIRKRKRFSKWFKPEESNDIDVVKEYYGYSTDKAKQALALLNRDQINILKQKVYKGGIRK